MTLVTIGDVDDLVDSAYTGFAYPSRRTKLELLENEADSSGNVVIQEGPRTYREATITVLAETLAQRDALRSYEEEGEPVTFIDNAGDTRSVLVFTFSSQQRAGGEAWDVTLVLLELAAPAEGS